MSNLNPGGSRAPRSGSGDGRVRIFGARNIARACQRNKIPEVDKPSHSIADRPHEHSREAARRLRQQAKREGRDG